MNILRDVDKSVAQKHNLRKIGENILQNEDDRHIHVTLIRSRKQLLLYLDAHIKYFIRHANSDYEISQIKIFERNMIEEISAGRYNHNYI